MAIVIIKKEEEDDMHSIFDAWDRGDHVLSETEGNMYKAPRGSKIGTLMSDWTICPIGNATCIDTAVLELYAYNPDKGGATVKVRLCPRGVSGDGEKCPLNK